MERHGARNYDENLRILKEQVDWLTNIVESVMDITRLELGSGQIKREPRNINDLVSDEIASFRAHAEDLGLRLDCQLDDDLPLTLVEPNQFSLVISNLLSNAIRYTPAGSVLVMTQHMNETRMMVLIIRDTGMGIDADDLPYLFDRFYRGKQAIDQSIPRSGLGLNIVKQVVDLHQGTIEVESEVGTGTQFRVLLPIVDS